MIQPVKGLKFLKTNEGHNVLKGVIFTISILVICLYGYFSIIFYPVMNEVQKLQPKTNDDIITMLSMVGFVVLSLLFVFIKLPFMITDPINKRIGWVSNNAKPTLPKNKIRVQSGVKNG